MKNSYNYYLALLFIYAAFFTTNNIFAQNPSYNLYAHNFSLSTVNQLNDKLEFDIHIEHTNPPVNFEY
ncbi:MAG: hypothetical protein ABIY50_07745, partial [Ignavibacteria bacterium]